MAPNFLAKFHKFHKCTESTFYYNIFIPVHWKLKLMVIAQGILQGYIVYTTKFVWNEFIQILPLPSPSKMLLHGINYYYYPSAI